MNDDDKELFGIVKGNTNHIKLILVKSMRNSDSVKWAEHAMDEIKKNKLFSGGVTCQYTDMYEIEGCKEYFLVMASSKKHKHGHSYIPEVREIIKGIHDAYVKNMCSQKPGDKWSSVKHRGLDVLCIDRFKDKTLSMLQLLYPSILNMKKEAEKRKAAVTQKEATRLMDLYDKSKKSYPDGQPVAPSVAVAVPSLPTKWSDTMSTITKLKFLLKAKLTSTTHPNMKNTAGYVAFMTNEKTHSGRTYAAQGVVPAPTRKLKISWSIEAQEDIRSIGLDGGFDE